MPDSREWSVPTPVRTLLWWPAISFVLVIVAPDAATGLIIAAGALLAVIGGLLAAAARRLTTAGVDDVPSLAPPAAELSTDGEPPATERAA